MTNFKEEFDNARIALIRAKHIAHEFDLLFYTEENRQIVKSTAINFFQIIGTDLFSIFKKFSDLNFENPLR